MSVNYFFPAPDYTLRSTLLWGTCIQHLHCASQEGVLGKRIVHLLVGMVEMIPIVGQIVALFERYLALHTSSLQEIKKEAPLSTKPSTIPQESSTIQATAALVTTTLPSNESSTIQATSALLSTIPLNDVPSVPAALDIGNSPSVTDLITGDALEPGDRLMSVKGTSFSANSLAKYCTTAVNDRIVTTAANQEIILWESGEEYLALLNQMCQLIEDPQLIAAIQLRIEGYPLAQAFIKEFNDAHSGYSFSALMNDIQKNMATTGGIGASFATEAQLEGFHAYYTLYSLLPEPIAKVIFPAYAVDTGDIHCIGSMSKVFSIQIERLEHLQLIMPPSSPSSTLESHTSLSTYISWIEQKYPIQQMPSPQKTHWAGLIEETAAQQRIQEERHPFMIHAYYPTLRYVKGNTDAHHALAIAIVEKYERTSSLFEGAQDPISKILQSTKPQWEKAEAIRNCFNTLETKKDLQLLQNLCTIDREIFRKIRDQLYNNPAVSNYPQDEEVWEKLSSQPEIITSYIETHYSSALPIAKTRALLVGTPMEISFCSCWDRPGSEPGFSGKGEFPFVLQDERTGEYHVLLSI